MPSPKPIKEFKEKITVNPKSVKVVKPTSSLERDIKNIKETGRVSGAKEGTVAKREAARVEMRNSGTKATVVPVRSNSGITGAGAKNVARLYRGGGIGMFGLPKNK